jgi:hypothetical protein
VFSRTPVNSRRKLGNILLATSWAFLFLSTMLDNIQFRLRDFKDLSFFKAMRGHSRFGGFCSRTLEGEYSQPLVRLFLLCIKKALNAAVRSPPKVASAVLESLQTHPA